MDRYSLPPPRIRGARWLVFSFDADAPADSNTDLITFVGVFRSEPLAQLAAAERYTPSRLAAVIRIPAHGARNLVQRLGVAYDPETLADFARRTRGPGGPISRRTVARAIAERTRKLRQTARICLRDGDENPAKLPESATGGGE